MAQRQKPTLAAANQFTPMVNKNVQNVETPMCFLKMGDLATPKLVKNSSSSKETLYNSPAYHEPLTPAMELAADTEVQSPINDLSSLADVKALLLTALNYIDKLEKDQLQPRKDYANASTQTKKTSIRKSSSSGDYEQQVKKPEPVERRELQAQFRKEVEKPRRKSTSRERAERLKQEKELPMKPILKQTKPSKPIQKVEAVIDPYALSSSDDTDVLANITSKKKKSSNELGTKSSSDSTELKTSSVSKKSSIGSPYSSWSTDSDGKNLQQRMHEMSIILRRLENELDDMSTKK
jgi:hypothetical protein